MIFLKTRSRTTNRTRYYNVANIQSIEGGVDSGSIIVTTDGKSHTVADEIDVLVKKVAYPVLAIKVTE